MNENDTQNQKEQDIAICKACKHFRHLTDPKGYFGVGFICMCHGKMVPWRKGNPHRAAATEEEFEQSHIYFTGMTGQCKCPQHPDRPKMLDRNGN